jgi:hypothetical protein
VALPLSEAAAAPVAAPLRTEGGRHSDARTEYRGAEVCKHADHLGAADRSIPLAGRQLAPKESSDSVELVRRQRLKKAADIGDRRFILDRLQRDAQTTQVHVIRGLPEHTPQQSGSVT